MCWFRLDDKAVLHQKVAKAGNEAFGAWVRAGLWSSLYAEDGFVPLAVAHTIARKRIWEKLLDAGLLDPTDREGYVIHDFLHYNPSAAERAAKREAVVAQRSAAGKASAEKRANKRENAGNPTDAQRPSSDGVVYSPTNAPRKFNPDPDPDPIRSTNELRDLPVRINNPEPEATAEPEFKLHEPEHVEPKRKPGRPPGPAKAKAAAPEGYAEVIDAYQRAFMARRDGAKPVISARTGAAAKTLLGLMPLADVVATIEAAFEDSWFTKTSGELWFIAQHPNRWRSAAPRFDEVILPQKFEREELTPEVQARAEELAKQLDDLDGLFAAKVVNV